jgi:two-component system, chemotaxis family, sensor kinase CheA
VGLADLLCRLAAAVASTVEPPRGLAARAHGEGSTAPRGQAKRMRTLRVGLHTLDRIMTLTGELSIARARLREVVEETRGGASRLDALTETDRLFDDLRDQVMRLRLVPLGPVFRSQARAVRDLAASHGKLARLVIQGDDVEVDTAVVEAMRDPLTHMIRNALDHGIETPAVRTAAGKPAVGVITLVARHDGGRILIEVRDDGAGFDKGRILERARAVGLLDEAAQPGDKAIYGLVFTPGFSTATTVTGLSGRGVGMDVVSRNIAALKGTITVDSEAGRGAAITVRLPLTLAIIDGFVVSAGGQSYVIPLESVMECVDMPGGDAGDAQPTGVVNLRGEALAYVRVSDLFSLPRAAGGERSLVVVEHDGMRAGLVVGSLHGDSQSVVKPLGTLFQGVTGVTGSTILGDGRVALILDVVSVLNDATTRGEHPSRAGAQQP